MLKSVVLSLLLLITACRPKHESVNPVSAKIVTNVIEFVTGPDWHNSHYAPLTDVEVPFKIVIAGDNTVCPIYTLDLKPVVKGELFHCPTRWLQKHD